MLPFQGAVFWGGIYHPGRCPGLIDAALSGRWLDASSRRIAGRMPAYPQLQSLIIIIPNYRTTRLSESRAQLAWLCRAIGLKAKSIIEFFSVEHECCEWHEFIVRREQKKDAALSGRSFLGGNISPRALPWADRCCPFRAMVCASFRRIAGRMPAYPSCNP